MSMLRVNLHKSIPLAVHHTALGSENVAYLAVVNHSLKYPFGRSRIAYVGSTQAGIDRLTASVANKTAELFNLKGINEFTIHLVTCGKRKRVRTWRKLEKALLLTFREIYGDIPRRNPQVIGIREQDEFEYFTRNRLRQILKAFEM